MAATSTRACALIALALVCALVLSGCAGGEAQPGSAESQGGVLGSVLARLEQGGDESEVRELAEQEPLSKEEREEAHEQVEQREVEEANAREGEESPAPDGEESPAPEGEAS